MMHDFKDLITKEAFIEKLKVEAFNNDLALICKKHNIEIKWYEFRLHKKLLAGYFLTTYRNLRTNIVVWRTIPDNKRNENHGN